jgi:hypothetical protein
VVEQITKRDRTEELFAQPRFRTIGGYGIYRVGIVQ